MPRLARQVTRAWFERLLKGKNRNKRSDHLATRETAYYILFGAKTRIYINKTHTQSRTENSLFQFCLPFSPIYLEERKNYYSLIVSRISLVVLLLAIISRVF